MCGGKACVAGLDFVPVFPHACCLCTLFGATVWENMLSF